MNAISTLSNVIAELSLRNKVLCIVYFISLMVQPIK